MQNTVNCKEVTGELVDYIDGVLDPALANAIALHVQDCPHCTKQIKEMKLVLNLIDNSDEINPPGELRHDFQKLIEQEKVEPKNAEQAVVIRFSKKSLRIAIQIAATILLVFSSYVFGRWQNGNSTREAITTLKNENVEMRKAATIALFDNKSASKQLQAVSYAKEFEHPGSDIIKALVKKMKNASMVNVRLASALALAKFSDLEMVRNALIEALEQEKNLTMQLELIQILVDIQEKRAIPEIRKLLLMDELPDHVKDQIKTELQYLI